MRRAGQSRWGAVGVYALLVIASVALSSINLFSQSTIRSLDNPAAKPWSALLLAMALFNALTQPVFVAVLTSRQTDIEQRLGRLEVSQKASLSRQNDIDSLRQEVAQLRGQLEDTLNQLQQAQKSQQDMSADMDSRLKRFEPTQVTIDGRQFSVEQAEKNEFDAALALFRKSNFKAADQAFAKFAKTYPESPYLPTALYWQGGAQYAQGNYNGAVNTLQSLIQRFPDSARKADALLLIGNAQVDAGNDKAARQTFIRIGKEHPNTPAANAARERLKAM